MEVAILMRVAIKPPLAKCAHTISIFNQIVVSSALEFPIADPAMLTTIVNVQTALTATM
jgi:hypothetical protein